MSASGSRAADEKMQSDHSGSSGDSSSSSDSSSGSSEGEEEVMEPVRILGHTFELPQELCEDYGLFREFFSMHTWEALADEDKETLKQYLPKFGDNDEEEKDKTIKMLFNHEPFHFVSPFDIFFNNLRQGNYRPDIAKMRKFLIKARAKQQKHKIKAYYAKLLPEVLISRERLLAAARGAPPGPVPSLPLLPPKPSPKNSYTTVYSRVKKRYFDELAAVRAEVGGEESEDDNYPDGPPEQILKKRKHSNTGLSTEGNVTSTLGGRESSKTSSLECLKNVLAAHRARRQYRENHPELNTAGITLEDIKQRVALVNGAKKLMFGGQKSDMPKLKRGPKPKDPSLKAKSGESRGGKKKEEIIPQENAENRPLLPNIKIKCEQEESDSESSSFVDPVISPKQNKNSLEQVEIKQEVIDPKYPNVPNMNYNESKLEGVIKQEPLDQSMATQNSRVVQPVPIKLEDLDGIDMMALPVEIADDSGEVVPMNSSSEIQDESVLDPDEALTETTHANFLSLVRALFPARAAHRASKQQLHARLACVMRSPIAPLNTWYSLLDDWCAELDSALTFLAGERGPHPEDFVPYLQYMPETQMYQWIGAGRDCDAILGRLCERWLHSTTPPAPLPPPSTEPPPPKYPTTWVVRPPTSAEIAEFRAQERKRFAVAAKPFTYVQHGYRSVVGPCARASISVGGHASLLVGDRPRHASFLALVRDAVARLPNGEGTRHDVLTLLKMSQWIAPCTEQALLTAVSAALDRMQSAKRDPLIKYDQRTAVWTYLHRHRSEDDWMKSGSGRSRATKALPALPAPAPTPATPVGTPTPAGTNASAALLPPPAPPAPPRQVQHTPPHAMEMEVASIEEVIDNGSDTDVDVDDSSSPTTVPHLSSAQLLMQATQSQLKHNIPYSKPKGKLVAVSPPKAKTLPKQVTQAKANATQHKQNLAAPIAKQTNVAQLSKAALLAQKTALAAPTAKSTTATLANQAKPNISQSKQNLSSMSTKQANLMTQAAKQASLMAQSAKQASVIAQLTKQALPKTGSVIQSKQVNVVKPPAQSPKQNTPRTIPPQAKPPQTPKQSTPQQQPKQETLNATQVAKHVMPVVPAPHKSPLIKQRPLQKQTEATTVSGTSILSQQSIQISTAVPSPSTVPTLSQSKLVAGTRSLLIRASPAHTAVTTAVSTSTTPAAPNQRRGIVRVLSPATPSGGKSLISPRALMQPGTPTTKKRPAPQEVTSDTTVTQSVTNATTEVSSLPTAVTSSVPTRTVQLAGGRTVQLTANQTVHIPGGQAVQLSSGHTLQLSSLQLPTHSVRLPSGQTVQLASPQSVRAVANASVKTSSPRPTTSSPAVKTVQSNSTVQIPISSVQLAGQTVQIAGQTVQLAGQSVQLTGHTVKLPSGQSVQVASQSVLPSQSVQLPSGQTVQLSSGNVQTVQLGQNVLGNQVSGQTVQLSGQTVQLAGGQTVQLPSGQTLQLAGGQTIQLSSGQTIQLSSGQAMQLANQQKAATQARTHAVGDKITQPIVAKLLTNAQGQMISLEGSGCASSGARTLQMSGMRVLSPARMPRPLLLTAAKPLHNMILQQGDGNAIRVTSSGGAATSQTIVLSNIGAQTVTTSTTTAPVLKLQQASSAVTGSTTTSGGATGAVRGVVMDAGQLKLVGGRHVLARILRPAQPSQPPPQ